MASWPDVPGTGRTVEDFAAWAFEDLTTNLKRSLFAEWLVSCALGVDGRPHEDWRDFDVEYRGVGIEVKSSAYMTPPLDGPNSVPRFDIAARTHYWDGTDMLRKAYGEPTRPAHIHVFCLLTPRRPADYEVRSAANWSFCCLATERIGKVFGLQKSVGPRKLDEIAPFDGFGTLRERVDRLVDALGMPVETAGAPGQRSGSGEG